MTITLVDPDGDHTAVYVDGELVETDNGMNHTSRFVRWFSEYAASKGRCTLDVEFEYFSVDLTERECGAFPPERLTSLKRILARKR